MHIAVRGNWMQRMVLGIGLGRTVTPHPGARTNSDPLPQGEGFWGTSLLARLIGVTFFKSVMRLSNSTDDRQLIFDKSDRANPERSVRKGINK